MQPEVELVRQIVEALSRGDLDEMLAQMDPKFEWTPLEASPVARVYRGHEQVRHYDGSRAAVAHCPDLAEATAMTEYATRERAMSALR
jgi:ketosteroid isomerase-like protein